MKQLVFLFVFLFGLLSISQLSAQRLGVGAQFGEPTGLSLRINGSGRLNTDILAAWNFNDYFFVNVHGLWERALIADLPQLHYFYGPGLFVGVRDRGRDNEDQVNFGISGSIGLNVYLGPVEIFGQITPRLTVAPGTDGEIGGGVGARFYFN